MRLAVSFTRVHPVADIRKWCFCFLLHTLRMLHSKKYIAFVSGRSPRNSKIMNILTRDVDAT